MKIIEMKWGCTGDGTACSTEVDKFLELRLEDGANDWFVSLCENYGCRQVRVASESLFEKLAGVNSEEDPDAVLEAMDRLTMEKYQWEEDELEPYKEVMGSAYFRAILLSVKAMEIYNTVSPGEEKREEATGAFLKKYAGIDVDEIRERDLPAVRADWDHQDFEDEQLHAFDIRTFETDPCGLVDTLCVDCAVKDKEQEKTVYVAIVSSPGDMSVYSIMVLKERFTEDGGEEQFSTQPLESSH